MDKTSDKTRINVTDSQFSQGTIIHVKYGSHSARNPLGIQIRIGPLFSLHVVEAKQINEGVLIMRSQNP